MLHPLAYHAAHRWLDMARGTADTKQYQSQKTSDVAANVTMGCVQGVAVAFSSDASHSLLRLWPIQRTARKSSLSAAARLTAMLFPCVRLIPLRRFTSRLL